MILKSHLLFIDWIPLLAGIGIRIFKSRSAGLGAARGLPLGNNYISARLRIPAERYLSGRLDPH